MVRQPSPWHITKVSQVTWPSPTTTMMATHILPTTHTQPSPGLLPHPHAPNPHIPTHINRSPAPSRASTTAFRVPPFPIACPPPCCMPPCHRRHSLHVAATTTPYVPSVTALYIPPLLLPFTSHHRPTLGAPAFHPSPPRAPHPCPRISGPTTAYPRALTLRQPPTAYSLSLHSDPTHGPQHAHIPHRHMGTPHDAPQAPGSPHVSHDICQVAFARCTKFAHCAIDCTHSIDQDREWLDLHVDA